MQEDDGLNVNVNVNVCVCVSLRVCRACVVRVYCKPAYKAHQYSLSLSLSLSLIMRFAIHQAKSLIYRLLRPQKASSWSAVA